jgi:hypothetical protein
MAKVRISVLAILLVALAVGCSESSQTNMTPTSSAAISPTAQSSPVATISVQPTPPPGAIGTPAPTVPTPSGITGTAAVGPTCPVQRIDSPCPDRPFQGTIIARNLSGTEVARTESDQNGAFGMTLPPGSYVIVALVAGPFPVSKPLEVTVLPSQVSHVQLSLDSGIR